MPLIHSCKYLQMLPFDSGSLCSDYGRRGKAVQSPDVFLGLTRQKLEQTLNAESTECTGAMRGTVLALVALFAKLGLVRARGFIQVPNCYSGRIPVNLTYEWLPKEGSGDEDDDGKPLTLTGTLDTPLKDAKGTALATVAKITSDKFVGEGMGLLADGRLLYATDREKAIYELLDRKAYPYGKGMYGAMVPLVSFGTADHHLSTTHCV